MDVKELNFGCQVEILSIKYKSPKIQMYIKPIMMQLTRYQFIWKLIDREMEICRNSGADSSLYSPNFNGDSWCIVFVPNGWSWAVETVGHLFAKIKLLKLPFGIKCMEIESEFIITSDFESVKWINTTKCSIKTPGRFDNSSRIKSQKFQNNVRNLTVITKMKLLKLFDMNGNKIPENKWINYGIYDYDKLLSFHQQSV